jgi:HAD superfamily hydrolase (TIGR01509 family)
MPTRALILDLDGLMLDTEPLHREVSGLAASDCGITLSPSQQCAFLGRRPTECSELLRSWFGAEFSTERFWERARVHFQTVFGRGSVKLKPGLIDLLDFAAQRNLPAAVASSGNTARVRRHLSDAGLLPRLAVIVTGSDVMRGKPAPDLFLLAAERLGTAPSDCLVLEDAEAGVQAAAAACMRVGIVPDLQAPTLQMQELAVKVFASLGDVIEFLQSEIG